MGIIGEYPGAPAKVLPNLIQFIPTFGAHAGENFFRAQAALPLLHLSFQFQAGQILVAQIQQEKDFQFMCGSALSYCRRSVMIATEGGRCEACKQSMHHF